MLAEANTCILETFFRTRDVLKVTYLKGVPIRWRPYATLNCLVAVRYRKCRYGLFHRFWRETN